MNYKTLNRKEEEPGRKSLCQGCRGKVCWRERGERFLGLWETKFVWGGFEEEKKETWKITDDY